jgi:hypothetical protein
VSGTKYIYGGGRSALDANTPMEYEGDTYRVGDEVTLSAAERDRLAPYFVFRDKDSGEDATPDVKSSELMVPEAVAEQLVRQESAPDGTIPMHQPSSASSRKS